MMHVGLYTGDATPYRLAAARQPHIQLRTLSPVHPDLTGLDALVVDDPGAPLYSLVRTALSHGMHVFARPQTALTVRQLVVLREAATRASRRLRLAGAWGESRPLKSLRRSLQQSAGEPHHLRSVRRLSVGASVDDATFEELALLGALVDRAPSSVACAELDVPGAPVARIVTLTGPRLLAAIVVTVLECGPFREISAAVGSRTARFEASDEGAHRLVVSTRETSGVVRRTEEAEPALDALVADAEAFFAGLDAPHEAAADQRALAFWGRAAVLWDAVSTSLEQGGAPVQIVERELLRNANPPPLRLIQGGGTDGPAHARPTLTVVR